MIEAPERPKTNSDTHASAPAGALLNDLAQLSAEYAEARWQRALLNVELRGRAIARIAWLSLLAIPPGMLAAYFAAHAMVQVLITWGMSPAGAYGTMALVMALICGGAVLVARKTAERWFA